MLLGCLILNADFFYLLASNYLSLCCQIFTIALKIKKIENFQTDSIFITHIACSECVNIQVVACH